MHNGANHPTFSQKAMTMTEHQLSFHARTLYLNVVIHTVHGLICKTGLSVATIEIRTLHDGIFTGNVMQPGIPRT